MNKQDEPSNEALQLAYTSLQDSNFDYIVSDDIIQEQILERVVELLTKNPERLMSILYKIDVQEQRINDVMKNTPIGGIAQHITNLILERMQEKVETRNKYRSQQQNDA